MAHPLNVLLVDDEPKICHILEQILIARGCSVRLAHDGLEGLAQFQQQPAEVVITDIKMPRMGGLELVRELKHLDPLVNIVVITAYPSVQSAVEAMQYGACDFITKPFDIAQVQAILYRCQQRLSLSRQLRVAGDGMLKLEELNRRLADLNEMKSQFLAAISHEINTPLCLMSEWIYLLSDGTLGKLSGEQQQAVDALIGAYDRLHVLLQQLVDLMHGHDIALHPQPANVADLLQQALASIAPRAAARSIGVHVQLPAGAAPLPVDRKRCLATFDYLLDNAIKFNREGGRIDIELVNAQETIDVHIRDTGIGIAPEELDRVFTAFYQVDRRLNRDYGGVGVGLTLAKRYVELHGGSLTLSSELGQGTTVIIRLPRHVAGAVPSANASPTTTYSS